MVQVLSRDGIQRMVRKGGGSSAAGGAGGGGGITSVALAQLTDVELGDTISDMDALVYSGSLSKWTNYSIADMATKTWVGQNYLSIAFFSRLFKAYNGTGDSATEVTPNDTTSTIDNIKAMFGFWTDAYVTALGSGGSISAAVYLSQLADVALSNPTDGQALVYDATTGKWKNGTVSSGVDMSTVWSALAAATNEQINYSHLSGAVKFGTAGNDYIPITIGSNTKNVLTAHQSLSSYATKTWVGNNYLALTGGTVTGDVQILQIEIHHTNEINNQSGLLHLQYRGNYGLTLCNNGEKTTVGGAMEIAGNVSMADGGRINIKNEPSGSALYIGNSNNAGWVRLSDMCSKDGTAGDTYWSIRTSGNAVFANVLSNGYVTALSDIRKKDVVGDFDLRVADIAGASLIRFTWKDGHDKDIHVGGIAQEWKRLLPEAVREDADGTLSMDYGVIAVVASVSIARKVVAQERIINAQGKKIAELEKRLARLEKMFAIDINDLEED